MEQPEVLRNYSGYQSRFRATPPSLWGVLVRFLQPCPILEPGGTGEPVQARPPVPCGGCWPCCKSDGQCCGCCCLSVGGAKGQCYKGQEDGPRCYGCRKRN